MQHDYDRDRSRRRDEDDDESYGRSGERGYQDRGRYGRGEEYGRSGGGREGAGDWERERYGREGSMRQSSAGRGDWERERYGREDWGREGSSGRGYGEGYGGERYGRQEMGGQGREAWGREGTFDRGQGESRQGWGRQGYGERGGAERGGTPYSWTYTEIWLIPGPHVGRGPRDYQRSDDRLREEVCERLTQHGQIDAGEVDVRVREGEVTLSGSVDDRSQKRLAEDVAESVSGVRDVRNEIRVRQQGRMGGGERREGERAMSGLPSGERTPTGTTMMSGQETRRGTEAGLGMGTSGSSVGASASGMGTSGGSMSQSVDRVTEGMDVVDRSDNKIGTVSRIHRPAAVTAGGMATGSRAYLELDTGFLGLGKTLFVPADRITDVTDHVRLDVDKDQIDAMGWDQRPDWIRE